MPNQKISELTAIVTVDTSLDVLPIVDTSANTTKKISPTALKTALALDNVNNTSDANKPVSTAQQDALNAKVTGNTAIVAATKTKITYDAKGLVTAGNILDAADMPTGIDAANIGTGVVSSTEFGYLDGVTSAIQTQLNAKQATLVSATNIKTINSTSLLGSGDIVVGATPSGVAGAIQFSNGSAFASDASNLFWDDTNNRLGVGTNAPTASIHATTFRSSSINDTGTVLQLAPSYNTYTFAKFTIGAGDLAAQLGIKGSGSTSATTSLLVQNSAGTAQFFVQDGGVVQSGLIRLDNNGSGRGRMTGVEQINGTSGAGGTRFCTNPDGLLVNASAQLQVDATDKGFLPPRMTTTQKNAIATPAAGLVVYDSTTNKLCCYNGSTWNDLF